MFEVKISHLNDLTPDEQSNASNNGAGKEYANYLRVTHNGKTLLLESDAMEPEDAYFHRDLSWVKSIIEKAYQCGVEDRPH